MAFLLEKKPRSRCIDAQDDLMAAWQRIPTRTRVNENGLIVGIFCYANVLNEGGLRLTGLPHPVRYPVRRRVEDRSPPGGSRPHAPRCPPALHGPVPYQQGENIALSQRNYDSQVPKPVQPLTGEGLREPSIPKLLRAAPLRQQQYLAEALGAISFRSRANGWVQEGLPQSGTH